MSSATDTRNRKRLFEFRAEQKCFDIGNIRVGGQPGVRPTVLIGSMFYHGDKIYINEDRDDFDHRKAVEQIRSQEDFSERTGNPGMLDVVGATPEAMKKHLEFVAAATKMPFLIDGTTLDVRLAGLEYVTTAGLGGRVVYNSIQPEANDEELRAVKKAGVTSAIVLTTSRTMDFTAEGKVETVRELLPRLQEAGITQPLIDTCVMDMATLGPSLEAIYGIKDEFGLPAGGGVHNAVALWRGLKSKMGRQAHDPCLASVVSASVTLGADFALYGPVQDAQYVFPAVAMIDTALSQIAMDREQTLDKKHPRFRIG